MEKVIIDIEDLQKQNDELKVQNETRTQQIQEQVQQVKQRLHDVAAAAISTRGQIAHLEDVYDDQTRERHQLEGMMQILSTMQQR